MLLLALSALACAVPATEVTAAVEATAKHRVHRMAHSAPSIGQENYAEAATGQNVTGLTAANAQGKRAAWGLTVIDAPIAQVWSAINDFSDRIDYSKVSFSQVQQGTHCRSGRQVFQYLPLGFPVSDRWWVSTLTINEPLRARSDGAMRELAFEATTDPSALKTDEARQRAAQAVPVGASQGGWLLVDIGGHSTLIEYFAFSEPGGSVPTSFANAFASSGVKSTLEAVAKLTAADPRCPE